MTRNRNTWKQYSNAAGNYGTTGPNGGTGSRSRGLQRFPYGIRPDELIHCFVCRCDLLPSAFAEGQLVKWKQSKRAPMCQTCTSGSNNANNDSWGNTASPARTNSTAQVSRASSTTSSQSSMIRSITPARSGSSSSSIATAPKSGYSSTSSTYVGSVSSAKTRTPSRFGEQSAPGYRRVHSVGQELRYPCDGCGRRLPSTSFSKNQRKLREYARCQDCIQEKLNVEEDLVHDLHRRGWAHDLEAEEVGLTYVARQMRGLSVDDEDDDKSPELKPVQKCMDEYDDDLADLDEDEDYLAQTMGSMSISKKHESVEDNSPYAYDDYGNDDGDKPKTTDTGTRKSKPIQYGYGEGSAYDAYDQYGYGNSGGPMTRRVFAFDDDEESVEISQRSGQPAPQKPDTDRKTVAGKGKAPVEYHYDDYYDGDANEPDYEDDGYEYDEEDEFASYR